MSRGKHYWHRGTETDPTLQKGRLPMFKYVQKAQTLALLGAIKSKPQHSLSLSPHPPSPRATCYSQCQLAQRGLPRPACSIHADRVILQLLAIAVVLVFAASGIQNLQVEQLLRVAEGWVV